MIVKICKYTTVNEKIIYPFANFISTRDKWDRKTWIELLHTALNPGASQSVNCDFSWLFKSVKIE
jgi:hypothetical protein